MIAPEACGVVPLPAGRDIGTIRALDATTRTWAVVLAGGQGMRLRALTRHVYGDERPKQFAVLTGSESLLHQTIDRVSLLVPRERTVVVTMAEHGSHVAAELRRQRPAPHVLEQPVDRGTAAAVLFAARWIAFRDPDATIVTIPSDHYVDRDALFMRHVADAVRAGNEEPGCIALLGAEPTEPEADYGWIELGDPITGLGRRDVYRVRQFREKPTQTAAEGLFGAGALWNTLVFAARAQAIIEAGRRCVPALHDRLNRLQTFLGTEHERWAVHQAYELSARANFSRAVLERITDALVALPLSGVVWRDLGTPRRVVRTLAELGLRPAWLDTLPLTG